MLFTIQLIIILICLFYGARKGGIALGLLGGIRSGHWRPSVFHLQPGKPPVDVMLVIIAVVAASATLQASGGLDVMLQIAEEVAAPQPRLNCRAVCDLYTDHSLRYGSCGLHHSADHLRRRH